MSFDRIILVGQAPSRDGDPLRPLVGGPTGERLRALTGLSLRQYLRRFERMNLLPYFPGALAVKGDRFPMLAASTAAARLRINWYGATVVFVGFAVAKAFDMPKREPFEWVVLQPGFRASLIPHTSPINAFWNDAANVERGKLFFSELLREIDEQRVAAESL